MKSYIHVIKGYNISYINLFLQWILENFHLNEFNVNIENYDN